MSRSEKENREALDRRVVELETLFTYLQQTVQDLDGVVLRQQERLEAAEATLGRLADSIRSAQESSETDRPAEEERPPHY